MKDHTEAQYKRLYKWLKRGLTINRVQAFNKFGIGDLRSRVSDVERIYNIRLERDTVKGKRYYKYWIPQTKLSV